jgi:quercetin dioxygenase-like cupin family protein
MMPAQDVPSRQALSLVDLLAVQPHSIASRVLARAGGGSVTLFTIAAGEGLSEHTSPYEALVVVLEGRLTITVGGTPMSAGPQQVVRLPATVPHALEAREATRLLLVMLKDQTAAGTGAAG